MKNSRLPIKLQFFAEGDGVEAESSASVSDSAHGSSEPTMEDMKALVAKLQADNIRFKNSIDKLSASEGNLRKQLKSKMTVDEQEAAAKVEQEEYVHSLERQVSVMKQCRSLQEKGFSSDEAEAIAIARFDGDLETALTLENKHYDDLYKKMEEEYNSKVAKLMEPASGADGIDYAQQFASAMNEGDKVSAVSALLRQSNFKR